MAAPDLAAYVNCPTCHEPINLGVTLRLDMQRMVLGIDTAPVHAHIRDAHPETDGLTVSADHPDNDDPPVACWHIEPDTPCDWNVCRQPERSAAGDRGTDPATHR